MESHQSATVVGMLDMMMSLSRGQIALFSLTISYLLAGIIAGIVVILYFERVNRQSI